MSSSNSTASPVAKKPSTNSNGARTTATRRTQQVTYFELPGLGIRFRIPNNRNLADALLDGGAWFRFMERMVYAIGPILIVLVLLITGLLTYAFFTIIVPMLREKYAATTSFGHLVVALHCAWVAFCVTNVLFNYYYCVITPNKGPNYDRVVRELASATNFIFPETPAQVEGYRREYEDRMVLRLRRRRERANAAAAQQEETAASQDRMENGASKSQQSSQNGTSAAAAASDPLATNSNMTQRRQPTAAGGIVYNTPAAQIKKPSAANKPPPVIRRWMLMGPFEWGFCGHSGQPKPPRSHYDHVSKTLVLNLDHYCPWMFNAIGYFNYRYFVNFLIYIFLGMLYGSLVSLEPFLLLSSNDFSKQWRMEKQMQHTPRLRPMLPRANERTLLTLCFMLCVAVGCAVLLLGGFHIYLLCSAQTTIEFHANWSNRRRAKQTGKKWKNPYSAGSWYRNWQQVYGCNNIFMALLPSTREPEFLPVPVPGHSRRKQQTATTLPLSILDDNDERNGKREATVGSDAMVV